jgi:hypothetical protein
LEALMLRAENLTVEVFTDEDDDGTRHAEALMLRNRDRRMVARGRARVASVDSSTPRIEDEQVAAHALADLVHKLVPSLGQGR